MAITIQDNFELGAVMYFKRMSEEEIIGGIAKKIRKMSRLIAEDIVKNMDINVYLKGNTDNGIVAIRARKRLPLDKV